MNYGHPLRFGAFLTPANSPPAGPVKLAVRAEELGYDLVTFQDHPYQPRFLDTWTLLSWVAGRTERVHLAANVLNIPLRDPTVLAHSPSPARTPHCRSPSAAAATASAAARRTTAASC